MIFVLACISNSSVCMQVNTKPQVYGMKGVMIAIFTEIRHLVEELITFLSFFEPQKLVILTARLNKSLSISTSNSMRGD